MKHGTLLSIVVFFMILFSSPASAGGSDFSSDKLVHAGVSYALAFSLTTLLKYEAGLSTWDAIALGGMTALFLGFAKELADGNPDEGDLWANGIGVLGASLFHVAVEF